MDEDYYDKMLLNSYESELKILKRSIKWSKAYIWLCAFNVFTFLANSIHYYGTNKWGSIAYLITDSIWIFLIIMTIRQIRTKKIRLNDCLFLYDSQLKKVDYPKYLKTQRTKKLNKIKKSLFKK